MSHARSEKLCFSCCRHHRPASVLPGASSGPSVGVPPTSQVQWPRTINPGAPVIFFRPPGTSRIAGSHETRNRAALFKNISFDFSIRHALRALFSARAKVNSCVIKLMCALCKKHRGWGGHLDYGYVTTLLVCPPASAARLSPTIDNDHSAKRSPPTAAPMSFDFCVRHALHALFSARAKVNSCVIKRMRTLLQKHRGWGWASRFSIIVSQRRCRFSSRLGRRLSLPERRSKLP